MNTTKLSLLLLLVAGCGGSMQVAPPPDGGQPDVGPQIGVSGQWSFHFVPFNRVQTAVPPPCDGQMTLAEDTAGAISGSWSCTNGSGGTVSGQRYGAGSVSIGFFSLAQGDIVENWGGGTATVTAASMTILWPGLMPDPVLTATRP